VRPKGRHIWAAAGLALLVAFIGGGVTDLGPWYQSLRQPPWKPPDLLFPPAWSLIFALSAWAGALA
jgi:tryptophan-rich sensory protein